MEPRKSRSNILIACEPCRQSKTRCNGAQPCDRRECQADPQLCAYRPRARRQRKSRVGAVKAGLRTGVRETAGSVISTSAISDQEKDDSDQAKQSQAGRDVACSPAEAYQSSITAAHLAPRSIDSSQLFYGPSSNFAFLQEIRRAILSLNSKQNPQQQQLPEAAGLESLMQRSIFFGIPHQIDPDTILSTEAKQPPVSPMLARQFLTTFKETSLHRLPFYTATELDDLLSTLVDDISTPGSVAVEGSPQTKAIFLVILAIGATGTEHTKAAEGLYLRAKRTAVILDEVVSLQMIWYAILLADYQLNMGRPNAAYLHVGVACRKAFSFGLHKEADTATRSMPEAVLRQHRVTLWTLYFYETFHSLSMGRMSSMLMCNISCPQPQDAGIITSLSELAHIMEAASETIYSRTYKSLRELYQRAEKLHERLRRFADTYNIGASRMTASSAEATVESMTMHTSYYLSVILVFRPFLVSSYAIQSTQRLGAQNDMWLHQACRNAVNAAQDSIRYASDAHRRVETCRKIRFQCFFIESACAILFYDILREPTTYAYNLSFIHTALSMLRAMVAAEPSTTASNTVRQVAQAIEHITKSGAMVMPTVTTLLSEPSMQLGPGWRTGDCDRQATVINDEQTTQDAVGGEHIMHFGTVPLSNANNALIPNRPDGGLGPSPVDYSTGLEFDVLTTDLFNFFPNDLLNSFTYS